MAKNKPIFQKQKEKADNNKQRIIKLSPEYIHINTATLNNKKSEIIILEDYDVLLETGTSSIKLSYDFPNLNENIITQLYPHVLVSTTPGFSLLENANIYISYYWKIFGTIYRLYAYINAYVENRRELPGGVIATSPTTAFINYKVVTRNKQVWSEIEKVLS